ncbi:SIS domain-containing protein [candidate division KSB1 bacterium]|nr:SIS domain-containing protein [candidate division KSB1 bacterium]
MDNQLHSLDSKELTKFGTNFTVKEIIQQPDLWSKTYLFALNKKDDIISFLNKNLKSDTDIIFTGAGTSAFIGNCLKSIFPKNFGHPARAVATTDIVTHPYHYFHKDKPTFLISFARSGDSPESLAAVELANQVCPTINHLIITCNAEGELAQKADNNNSLTLVLPPQSNDQGLAMTSSFTSMLLLAILISKINQIEFLHTDIDRLSQYGDKIIRDYSDDIKMICDLPFERAVFLGSGPLLGCAEECHLKLQELTDGIVISKFDSFLGFRHGPKAVVNSKTLMVYLCTDDPYISKYEVDLINAVNKCERGIYSIAVLENDIEGIEVDLKVILSDFDSEFKLNSDLLPVCYTLIGQLLGLYKSLQLGLKPDNPSVKGTISRVVQGVRIYPLLE